MDRKFPIIPFFILVFVACITLFYFSFNSLWVIEKHPVTIAVSKTPLSTPFYVAKSIGAFDETCVSVTYNEVIGGQKAFADVIDGKSEFGTTSDSVIAFQSLSQKAFVTHAMFVQSDNDVKLITRPEQKIISGKDLKDKKLGVTKSTASEYFLSNVLALDGLTVEDVTLLHYKPDKLMDAFVNNEVDAITPWEPFAFQSKQILNEHATIHDTKNLNTLSFHLISKAPDSLLIEKSKCILQGLSVAIDYISANPLVAQKIIKNKLQLEQSFIDWIWPDYIFKLGLNRSLILNIESQALWAIDTQMTTYNDVPDIHSYIDTRALLQVAPRAVNIN